MPLIYAANKALVRASSFFHPINILELANISLSSKQHISNMTILVKEASTGSVDMTKDCDVSTSTSEDVSTCSVHSSQCGSQPVEESGELMEVTVTVISLDGVVAKKYQPKSKLPTKQKKTPKAMDTAASIVASFSQDLSNQKVPFFTHVPSLPIEISESSGTNSNPVIKWPNTNTEEKQVLSTVQLTREFQREKTTTINNNDNTTTSSKNRFVPQMCPINISISRHGKLINLGKASLFISGEEKGDATINIPIFSSSTHDKSNAKKGSVKKVKGSKKSSTPMMRIKGDSLQFGLKSDAMLRILVSVAGLRAERCETGTPSIEEAKEDIEQPACVTYSHVDCKCLFDDDDDSIEQDPYEDYIKAANESNEIRSLRQQLRNSEDIIQSLQIEHDASRNKFQEEIERLGAKLKQSTQNSETLLQELNQSKSESEIVPFLETRINDFLEELKKKDTEIECLRDEVAEIRKYYKNQVNTLLWDSQDPDNTTTANWKAAIGSAALKATKHIRDREVGENNLSSQDEEKKSSDHSIEESTDALLWDNQNGNEGNRAANWRSAIGTAALKARQHLLERENRQREGVKEIVVTSDEEKNSDGMVTMEEPNLANENNKEKSDDINTTEESITTGEKDGSDEALVDKRTPDDVINGTVHNNTGRAANWKNAIGSAFRRDNNADKVSINDESLSHCQKSIEGL
jgi:hypothetical protein